MRVRLLSLVFFFIGQVCFAASPIGFFKENANNAAEFPKSTIAQERVLATNTTFSKSYFPFENITRVYLNDTVATNSSRYMTCG